MVDGVNFNPFTGKVLTAEEIQKLDENRDGIVSYEELTANISWVTQEQDVEGDVQIEEPETTEPEAPAEPAPELDSRGEGIYNAAINNGAQSTANDKTELEQYLTKVESQYIEKLLDESGIGGTSDASALITYMKNQKTEFLNEYLQKNPEGPYDMEAVSAAYIESMDSAYATRQEGVDAFYESVENKKASAGNFDGLHTAANDNGNYMDADEFQELKNQAVDYILGQMLNGEVDTDFLSALSTQYQNDVNYIAAQNAIKTMQTQSDPAKMQEYLDKAEEAIGKLIGGQNVDGSSKLVDAINSTQDARQQAEYQEQLQALADEMAERYSSQVDTRSDAGQKDLDNYSARLDNAIKEFLENYDGTGDIEEKFQEFFKGITSDYQTIENSIKYLSTRSADGESAAYDALVNNVESAGTYISNEEQENIINAATDLFMDVMLTGGDESAIKEIYPNYATSSDYQEAKALFDGLATSATPQEDYDKIKELLNNMLKEYGADKIADGVKTNESKNIDLQPGTLTSGIWGYGTKDTYGNDNKIIPSFSIDDNGEIKWTNNNDKGDIEKILTQLEDRIKAELKDQLGALYNEADIEKYFDDAVLQQLINIGDNNATVTVESFVDGIIKEFNEIATNGLKGTNSNDGTIDRTQVLKDSGAVDDYAASETRGGTHWKSSHARDDAKGVARQKLEMLRASLLAQAQSILGDDYVASDIETMIDQSITSTVDSANYWDTRGGARDRYAFDPSKLYDTFLDTFEDKLKKYQNNKK